MVNGFVSAIFIKTINCVGEPIDRHLKCTYLGKSTGTLWIFILMSIPVMKYVYIVVYKDYSS